MPSLENERLARLPERARPIRAPAKSDIFNVHQELDVRKAIEVLAARVPGVREVLIFGSRRFKTGSTRSDVDLLLLGDELPTASAVASIAREIDSYLDVFIVHGGVAQSAVNESVIAERDRDSLFESLKAVSLWREAEGWIAEESFASVRVLGGFNPPYTMAAAAGPEPLVSRAEIVFVSALAEEHSAMVAEFDRVIATPSGASAHYVLGEMDADFAPRRVAACVADRAGAIAAALTAHRSIEMFRPDLVVLVGITAGIAGRLALGDLIVPDTVAEYEAAKITDVEELSRGRQHATHPPSMAAIQAWPRRDAWLAEISAQRPDHGKSQLSTDAMASGNKVVASAQRASLIAATSGKTAAIEMESLGVVEACQRADPLVPTLVVKAVSDLADEHKDDSWHPFAKRAAARLAAALVRDRVIPGHG